jgi:predicted deacylase
MKQHSRLAYLEVGQVGSFPIRVPITIIGDGKPHLAIVCGIHGDEMACLVISRYFVRKLLERDSLHGTVSIITAANPLAQAIRTRVGP